MLAIRVPQTEYEKPVYVQNGDPRRYDETSRLSEAVFSNGSELLDWVSRAGYHGFSFGGYDVVRVGTQPRRYRAGEVL